jgi:hypothetical protein
MYDSAMARDYFWQAYNPNREPTKSQLGGIILDHEPNGFNGR